MPATENALDGLHKKQWRIPAVCLVIALVRRASGWDPPSLWLDDQWVALAVRNASIARLYQLHIPSPIGFTLLSKWAASWSVDPEWPLQIVPFVVGLAIIPVCYLVLARVVRRTEIAALGCLVAACHPVAELYATRVKHYTLDALIAFGLWWLFIELRLRPSRLRFAGLIAASLLAPVLSFASLFVSTAAVHALLLDRWWPRRGEVATVESRREAKYYLAGAAVFDLGVLLLYIFALSGQSNPAMKAFWYKHFLRLEDPASLLDFAWRGLLSVPVNAVSPWFALLLWPLWVGITKTLRKETLRPLVWALGLLFVLQLMAAGLRVYPMGAERTDLFAYPLYWIVIAIGADHLLAAGTPLTLRGLQIVAASVVIAAVCRPTVAYSEARDREAVERMLTMARPGDGFLMHHTGLLALAYYGGRPVQVSPFADVSHGFVATPDFPNLFVIPMQVGGVALRDRPELARAPLQSLYERGYARLLFLSTHMTPDVDRSVLDDCDRHGYHRSASFVESARAVLYVLTRQLPERAPDDGLARRSAWSAQGSAAPQPERNQSVHD